MVNFRTILTFTLGVSFCAHIFLYFSLVRFFGISRKAYKRGLAGLLAFLYASAILATYISHLRDNALTRAFYFFGWSWLGLFFYLFVAAIAGWLVVGIARSIGRRANTMITAGLLFSVALVYSGYGVWNAFHPRITNVEVTIKDLPGNWKGKTIVQLSDVHLGHVYRADFLSSLVTKVNGLRSDMVVITGDLFDGMDGSLSELAGPLHGLRAPEGVYFITGNHEGHLGVENVYSIMKTTGVTVLNDEVRDVDGLQLAGISYPVRGRRETKIPGRLLKSLAGFVPGKPTVLLYHSPVGIAEAAAAGVGLQLSGHTHKGQLFPFGFITERIYNGYDYGLHRIGDYSIYTTNGVGTWGPPMRTGNTPEIVYIRLD
ncbi:MAG TPA: metallophosphoesterase [Nitrospirota bacterium]